VEAADRVGPCERDQAEQQVPAGRLRGKDVLAEPLAVLERVDAGQVDALVVVGVAADEAPEEQCLRRDERRQSTELPEES
jgi:hypothetical protein